MERNELISLIDERLSVLGISASEASRRATGNHYLIRNIKKRAFNPSFDNLNKLCDVLGLNLNISGGANEQKDNYQPENPHTVKLVGFAGAGGSVAYDGELHDDETAPAPPGTATGLVAIEIRGDSAAPFLHEGDRIYIRPDQTAIPQRHIGEFVLATCTDGSSWVKILLKGNTKGMWNLHSTNPLCSLMEDVEVDHVSPIIWVQFKSNKKPFQKVG